MAKKSPISDLQKKSSADLTKELQTARVELMKVRFAAQAGAERATHKIAAARKLVARILTVIRHKELAA